MVNRLKPDHKRIFKDEGGGATVVALLVLILGTIIAVASITTSTVERESAFNFLNYERTFYAAEAGLERAKEMLKMQFARQTAPSNPQEANWSFAITGAADSNYAGGVKLLQNQTLDGINYTVTIWDNKDEGLLAEDKPNEDKDRMIWVRSEAWDPRGGRCSIEALLHAKNHSDIRGYDTQSYGGPDKASTSNDKNTITEFSRQL